MNKYLASLIATLGFLATPALAETTECTEITTIPIIITAQGVYCLKGNLLTSLTSGNAIDIQTNNVTIDFNGFKLGGLAAGAATAAFGVYAVDRKNIVLRNGSIRGFYYGIYLVLSGGTSSGHLLEDLILDGNRQIGAAVEGTGMVVRNNRIVNTGPGDTTTVAYGLLMQYSANSQIVGNFISKTTETALTRGVLVANSSLIEVRGNTVLDTDGGTTDVGVYINNGTGVTVIDNRVLNAAGTGTTGIHAAGTSSGINCIDNTVAGFTTAISGCDYPSGNHTP